MCTRSVDRIVASCTIAALIERLERHWSSGHEVVHRIRQKADTVTGTDRSIPARTTAPLQRGHAIDLHQKHPLRGRCLPKRFPDSVLPRAELFSPRTLCTLDASSFPHPSRCKYTASNMSTTMLSKALPSAPRLAGRPVQRAAVRCNALAPPPEATSTSAADKEQVVSYDGVEFVVDEDPDLKSTWGQRAIVGSSALTTAALLAQGVMHSNSVVATGLAALAGFVFAGASAIRLASVCTTARLRLASHLRTLPWQHHALGCTAPVICPLLEN